MHYEKKLDQRKRQQGIQEVTLPADRYSTKKQLRTNESGRVRVEDLDRSITDSQKGEMIYYEPNFKVSQMSPYTEGNSQTINATRQKNRSPNFRESVVATVKHDLGERPDLANMLDKKPIRTIAMSIPLRKDDSGSIDYEKSPTVLPRDNSGDINYYEVRTNPRHTMGGFIDQGSYQGNRTAMRPNYQQQFVSNQMMPNVDPSQIKTYNPRMGQNNPSMMTHTGQMPNPYLNNSQIQQTNTFNQSTYGREGSNENLFIDKPLHVRENYIQGRGRTNMMIGNPGTSYYEVSPPNLGGDFRQPIDYGTDPRLSSKISPNRNEENQVFMDPRENEYEIRAQKLKDIKRMGQFIANNQQRYDMGTGVRHGRGDSQENMYRNYANDLEKMENIPQSKTFNQNALSRKPPKRKGTLIFKESLTYKPLDELAGRHQAVKNVNKLSNILMSRSAKHANEPQHTRERSLGEEFDVDNVRATLRDHKQDARKNILFKSASPHQKFIRITMAMLSSKGPNCEDRPITRDMRIDKGGVVDLAQNKYSKNKYKIKNIVALNKSPTAKKRFAYSMRDRERAAKICQAWWRDILSKYQGLLGKIIKIQSVFRGHWLRVNMYDLIYVSYLIQIFQETIMTTVETRDKQFTFDIFVKKFNPNWYTKKLIKIQRFVKNWLSILRDKKKGLLNTLLILALRRKYESFEAIRDFGEMNAMDRFQRLDNLLQVTHNMFTSNILKDFVKRVQKMPLDELKHKIIRNLFRKHLSKLQLTFLRQFFMKWLKRCIGRDDYKQLATSVIFKEILRPIFKDVTDTLRAIPPKEQKTKLLRSSVRRKAKKIDDIVEEKFKRWRNRVSLFKKDDIIKLLNMRLWLKTAKKLQNGILGNKFRLWHANKENSKDLRRYIQGLKHVDNHVNRVTWDQSMPPLRSATKGVQYRVAKEIFRHNKRFQKIPLREHFNRWKAYVRKAQMIDTGGRFLAYMSANKMNKLANRILLRRFLDWRRKAGLDTLMSRLQFEDLDKKRAFGTIRLMELIDKRLHREGLKAILPTVQAWLDSKIKEKLSWDFLFKRGKCLRLLLRNYFLKWRKQVEKLQNRELRSKFFSSMILSSNSKVKQNFLRRYFKKWLRNLPKNVQIKYYQGADKLRSGIARLRIKKPLEAFQKKKEVEFMKDGIVRAFGLKDKYLKRHWRDYLKKWRDNVNKLKTKEMTDDFSGKLLKNFSKNRLNRILSNRFSHWKKVPKVNMHEIYEHFKNICNGMENIKSAILRNPKKTLIDTLKVRVSNKWYKKIVDNLLEMATVGHKTKLRYFMNLWRFRIKDLDIRDLNIKLFKSSINNNRQRTDRNNLYHGFNKWRQNCKIDNLLRNNNRHLNLYRGVDNLNKLKTSRMSKFMTQLHKLMNLDHRGAIMNKAWRRLMQPRTNLGNAFYKWRKRTDEHKNVENERENLVKLLAKDMRGFEKRIYRDRYINAFNWWRRHSQRPSDYYEKVAKGKDKVNTWLKNKLRKPYNNILAAKNYNKLFMRALPKSSKLRKRMDEQSVLRLWNRWKKLVNYYQMLDNRALIIKGLSKKNLALRSRNTLGKAFRRWAGIKKKTLHWPNLVKGSEIVENVLRAPHRKPIIDGLKDRAAERTKNKGISLLFGRSKTFRDKRLRAAFLKWYKNSLHNDEARRLRAQRTMRRTILKNWVETPLEYYFHLWMRKFITKPFDIMRFVKAVDTLKKPMKTFSSKKPFEKLKDHVSPTALRSVIRRKVIPNNAKSYQKKLAVLFNLWRKSVLDHKLKQAKLGLLGKLYSNGKSSVRNRFLRSYFRRWLGRKKKPVDLARVIEGNDTLLRMFAKKYLPDFFNPKMKDYAQNRFLRSLLNKNSRFHQRALKPFFDRWNSKANKLKARQTNADFGARLINRTSKLRKNEDIQNTLRNRLRLWDRQAKGLKDLTVKRVPDLVEKLKKFNINKNAPPFLSNLNALSQNNQKKTLLRSGAKRRQNKENIFLKAYLWKWKKRTDAGKLKDFRDAVVRNNMNVYAKKHYKNILSRHFYKWAGGKEKKIPIYDYRPTKIGMDRLKSLYLRKPWDAFIKRASNMNLKIPYGMSLSEALIRTNKNVAKGLVIRNMSLRPYWKKFLDKNRKLKAKEERDLLFSKMFNRQGLHLSKTALRRYLRLWSRKHEALKEKEQRKALSSQLCRSIYNRNSNMNLRKFFNRWKSNVDKWHLYLKDASLGLTKVKYNVKGPLFRRLLKGLHHDPTKVDKFLLAKKMIISAFRNLEKGNLFYLFSKWRNNNQKLTQQKLKYRLLKTLANKNDSLNGNKQRSALVEKFLKWRILANPKNFYENINKIRQGAHKMQTGVLKKYNNDFMPKLRSKAREAKRNEMLYKWLFKYDDHAKKELLRIKLRLWKVRVGDDDILKQRLKKLTNDYLRSTPVHEKLYTKNKDDIVDVLRTWPKLKNDKALKIQDFAKSLLLILQRMNNMKRAKVLHSLMSKLSLRDRLRVSALWRRWKNKALKIRTNDSAKIIQDFLREKMDKIRTMRDRLGKASDALLRFRKKYAFNNLNLYSILFRRRQLLLRCMKDVPEDLKKEFLKKYLLRWWGIVRKEKEDAAALKITNRARALRATRKRQRKESQRDAIEWILKKKYQKHAGLLDGAFQLWKAKARKMKNNENAKIIQDFVGPLLYKLQKERAQDALIRLIIKKYAKEVAKAVTQASKVVGDRGEVMYMTLRDIFYQTPFDKLRLASKWIGRIRQLRSTYPMVQKRLRLFHLPRYLRLWHKNTVGFKLNQILRCQNFVKNKLRALKERTSLRKKNLIAKYMAKMSRDDDLKKRIYFKFWTKAVLLSKLNKTAANVQGVLRGNNTRNKFKNDLSKDKLKNVLSKLATRKSIGEIKKLSAFTIPMFRNLKRMTGDMERRYAANNLMQHGNNTIRNAMLLKLTGKRCYANDVARLRFWFGKWKENADVLDKSAKIVQNNYRNFRANRKKKNLQNLKLILNKYILKYAQTDEEKKRSALRIWNTKAMRIKVNQDAKIIQDFCRQNLEKIRTKRLKDFFANRAPKLAKKRTSNLLRANNLKNTSRKIYLKDFFNNVRNKFKHERLFWIFAKRFGDMNDQLKSLYLRKYLRLWKSHATKLANRQEAAALLIETNFRSANMRRFVRLERLKKQKLMTQLMKYINAMDVKKQLAFRLWSLATIERKSNDASKIIQDFCREGLNRLRKKREQERLAKADSLLRAARKGVEGADKRKGMKKLKEEDARNKIKQGLEKLPPLRTDRLRASHNKIKEYADYKKKKFDDMSKRIQTAWKLGKYRKSIWWLIKKIQRLRYILSLMLDREKRIKYKAMRLWNKNALIPVLNKQARVIQDFCRLILEGARKKREGAIDRLRKLFRDYYIDGNVIPVLRNTKNGEKLRRLKDHFKRYALQKFRYNVYNYDKIRTLNHLFRLPVRIRQEILRKWLRLWNTKAEALKKKEASNSIQQNFRSYRKAKKKNDINENLKKRIKWLHLRYSNMKLFYLRWWKNQTEKLAKKEAAKVICDFVEMEFKRIKAKKNWWKLSTGLLRRKKIDDGLALLNRYRKFRAINNLFDRYDKKLKRTGFDGIQHKGRLRRMANLLKSIFGNFDKRQDTLRKYRWWNVWRDNVDKLRKRDEALNKMVKAIDTRDKIQTSKDISNACQMKRLSNLLKTIKAKLAMKKLKQAAERKRKLESLGDSLVKGRDDLLKKSQKVVKDNLYKLYVYKVLKNMIKGIEKVRDPKLKNFYGKFLLNQLKNNLNAHSKDQTQERKQTFRSTKPKKMNFNSKSVDPAKAHSDSQLSDDKLHTVPHLVKLLDGLRKNKLRDANDKLKNHARNKKMADALQKYYDKNSPLPEAYRTLIMRLRLLSSKPDYEDELRRMFRMRYLKHITDELRDPARMLKTRYLIRLAFMHKNINDKKFYRELIRKWKFHALMKKFLRQKSQIMYKQMHVNYLSMVEHFIGEERADGHGNGSLYNEIDYMGEGMGLFTNPREEGFYGFEKEFSQVKKNYIFDPIEFEEMEFEARPGRKDSKRGSLYEKYGYDVSRKSSQMSDYKQDTHRVRKPKVFEQEYGFEKTPKKEDKAYKQDTHKSSKSGRRW